MTIDGVRASGGRAPFLPLTRHGPSAFALSLRGQIRSEVNRAIGEGLSGNPQAALNTVRANALQQSVQYHGLNLATSGQWSDLSRSIGSQYLPPQLADVFVRQMALESGNFDPDVIDGHKVSAAGAQGIAQLMPASYPNVNRLDPVASLNAAAGTMRGNLQAFGGDIRQALAAYNAGAGTVRDLVSRLGANWESGLPAETRQYLRELAG